VNKMDAKTLELLSAYMDGEVTPQERTRAEKLLRSDKRARETYHKLERTRSLLGELPRLNAPTTVLHGVRLRLQSEPKPGLPARIWEAVRPIFSPAPAVAFVGTAFVIAATILLLVVNQQHPPGEEDSLWALGEKAGKEKGPAETESAPQVSEKKREKGLAEGSEESEEAIPGAGEEVFAAAGLTDDTARRDAAAGELPPAESRAGVTAGAGAMRDEDRAGGQQPAITAERSTPAAAPNIVARYAGRDRVSSEVPISEPIILSAREEAQVTTFDDDLMERAQQYRVTEAAPYIAERGEPLELNETAQPGSDINPLFDPATFVSPQLPSFHFLGRGMQADQQQVLVHGEAHVSRDGRVIYLRLVGQKESARLIEALADRLAMITITPARWKRNTLLEALSVRAVDNPLLAEMRAQGPVSVFYSFVISINRAQR
jgi:hypothetical protein